MLAQTLHFSRQSFFACQIYFVTQLANHVGKPSRQIAVKVLNALSKIEYISLFQDCWVCFLFYLCKYGGKLLVYALEDFSRFALEVRDG